MRYDAYCIHTNADCGVVDPFVVRLISEYGLRIWVDRWDTIPGTSIHQEMESVQRSVPCHLVFFGPAAPGPVALQEMQIKDPSIRVLPVVLAGGDPDSIPLFLRARVRYLDFRFAKQHEEQMRYLVAGIRNERPGPPPGLPLVRESALEQHIPVIGNSAIGPARELARKVRVSPLPVKRLHLSSVAAAIFTVSAAASVIWLEGIGPPPRFYETTADRTAEVSLEDGSSLALSPATSVRARFSKEVRDLQIMKGLATLSLAQEPRPAYLRVNGAQIAVAGAKVSISVSEKSSQLHVEQGVVRISSSTQPTELVLNTDDTARISADGRVELLDHDRQFTRFIDSTLGELAARYNSASTFRLIIEGPARDIRMSGFIDVSEPSSLFRFLEYNGLVVQICGRRAIVRKESDVKSVERCQSEAEL
jgi:ferric-dicitrate binding protein FerR (iron transport regulator)